MTKKSTLNILLLLFSLVAAVVVFFAGEGLLRLLSSMPFILQCAIYLAFVMVILFAAIFLSEKISTGYYIPRGRISFSSTCAKAAPWFIAAAFAVGLITQLIYGVIVTTGTRDTPNFRGTLVVSDISGSMSWNDPQYISVDAMVEYIEAVPLGEYFGLIIYNHVSITLREYSILETDEERYELIEEVRQIHYNGGTNTYAALMDAFAQIRNIPEDDWPGLILLLSDGDAPMNWNSLAYASRGDRSNHRNAIPVSAIFFGDPNHSGADKMLRVAETTGGAFSLLELSAVDDGFEDLFSRARADFEHRRPHLLMEYFGPGSNSVLRIISQILLLAVWGIFIGVAVVVFLNNMRLKTAFLLPRVIVSLLAAVAFAFVVNITNPYLDFGFVARGIFALAICLLYLPTYSWGENIREGHNPAASIGGVVR